MIFPRWRSTLNPFLRVTIKTMTNDWSEDFVFRFDPEILGQLFMPKAGTFEVFSEPVELSEFVVDQVEITGESGRCVLAYSEWEEDDPLGEGKVWVSEFSIALTCGETTAFATYSTSFRPEQRDAGIVMDRLRKDAEEDFMLCAKLLGRSVRRDLVVDEDMPARAKPGANLH